ncbi:MAG TPA: hypothetical protein VGN04_12265 [Herbaspirillum sp.]|jgi:hypothetical protein
MTEVVNVGNCQMPTQFVAANDKVSTVAEEIEVDLSKGALEFRLNAISMKFTRVLKNIAANGVEEQKTIHGKLDTLNKVLDALQKMVQTGFSEADMYKLQDIVIAPSARSRAMARITARAEEQRRNAIKTATDAERAACKVVEDWEWNKISSFKSGYNRMKQVMTPEYMSAEVDGNLRYIRYWGYEKGGKKEWIWFDVKVQTNFWYPSWAFDQIDAASSAKQSAVAAAEKKYQAATKGVTLAALLYSLDVYAEDEELPTTKEELEIAAKKVSDMISSLQSAESTLETDTNGINNNWQREFDEITKRVAAFTASIRQLIEAAH